MIVFHSCPVCGALYTIPANLDDHVRRDAHLKVNS